MLAILIYSSYFSILYYLFNLLKAVNPFL